MRRAILLLTILIGLLTSSGLLEAVTVSPSSITIPRGTQSVRSFTHTFNFRAFGGCSNAVSTRGVFRTPNEIFLGSVNTPLLITLPPFPNNMIGSVRETVVIPVAVVKRAEQLGFNQFTYAREFSVTHCSATDAVGDHQEIDHVQIVLTGEATAEFSINRLQIYFENQRAEITVKKNQPGVKAFIDIRFTGSGLLRGHWEVDGRILSHVNKHLVYGRQVTLEFPDLPRPSELQYLPTIDVGTHLVRFVITSPVQTVTPPEAIYFVTAEEYAKRPIRLLSPANRSEEDYFPVTFRWEGRDQPITYLVEFLDEEREKPIFSAYTKRNSYALPLPVLKSLFSPGKSYFWRVKGFDEDNKMIGESPEFKFTFRELDSHVPGQILLLVETARGGP